MRSAQALYAVAMEFVDRAIGLGPQVRPALGPRDAGRQPHLERQGSSRAQQCKALTLCLVWKYEGPAQASPQMDARAKEQAALLASATGKVGAAAAGRALAGPQALLGGGLRVHGQGCSLTAAVCPSRAAQEAEAPAASTSGSEGAEYSMTAQVRATCATRMAGVARTCTYGWGWPGCLTRLMWCGGHTRGWRTSEVGAENVRARSVTCAAAPAASLPRARVPQAQVLKGNFLFEWSQMQAAVGAEWRPLLDAATGLFRDAKCPEKDIRGALRNHSKVSSGRSRPRPVPMLRRPACCAVQGGGATDAGVCSCGCGCAGRGA